MEKRNWWYGQPVTEGEMDEIFDLVEKGVGNLLVDTTGQIGGVCGTDVVPYAATPPNNTVKIPVGCAYADEVDAGLRRVPSRWAAIQTINCAVDYLAASTQPGAVKERYLSIFVKFVRLESDPKTDLHGNPLNYDQDETFVFQVRQTADANPGVAVPVPTPGTNYTRVCDVRVTNAGWGTISDPVDPTNPGDDEIDYTGVTYLGTVEVRAARYGRRTLVEGLEDGLASNLQMGARRQVLGNGNFDIWQRDTSFSPLTDATFTKTADRWSAYENLAVGTLGITRSVGGPTIAESGVPTNWHLLATCGVADATVGAAEQAFVTQVVEGFRYFQLSGGWATMTFWAKAKVAGTYCVAFQTVIKSASWVEEYTISAANTWEKKTVRVRFDESVGTWSKIAGGAMRVVFCLSVGSNRQTATTGAWLAGDYIGTASQTNLFANAGDTFELAQVQLNAGLYGMRLATQTYAEALAECQRYFEKSYEQGTDVGATTDVGCSSHLASAAAFIHHESFRVVKMSTPTVHLYSTNTGTIDTIYNVTDATDDSTTPSDTADSGFNLEEGGLGISAGDRLRWHWTADVEMT